MSEKYDNLFKELKDKNLISLYYNRVMFYDEGFGEIQFWNLAEDSDYLILENKGVSIYFDKWELSDKCLYIHKNDTIVGCFKFPNEKKLIANHNHFYVDQFTLEMSDILDKNVEQKNDWTAKTFDEIVTGLKHNLGKLKKSTENDEFRKSCVDIANYAMMAYYLNRG